MENQGYPAYEEQLDLKRYFQIIIRHKWLGLIIMVMVAVLVALYSLSLPESYDASFDIYYSNKNQQSVSNDNDVSYQSLDVDY